MNHIRYNRAPRAYQAVQFFSVFKYFPKLNLLGSSKLIHLFRNWSTGCRNQRCATVVTCLYVYNLWEHENNVGASHKMD